MDDENLESTGLPDFLRDPLGIPVRRWPFVTAGGAVGLALTIVLWISWVPTYVASSSILVANQRIPEEFVRATVQEDPYQQLNAVVSRVLSRDKLAAMVEQFDLYAALRETRPMADVVLIMRNAIEVEPEDPAGAGVRHQSARLFTLSYEGENPIAAADVTNALATLFVEAGLKDRIEQAGQIEQFLRHELEKAERELRQQDELISQFKEGNRGHLPTDLETNLRQLERLASQRNSLMLQISEAETRMAMMAAREVDPNAPESRLADLRARLDAERAVRTDAHPAVLSLRRQVAAIEKEVAARANDGFSPSGVVAAAQRAVEQLREQLVENQRQAEVIDLRVARTPRGSEDLAALVEKETVLREKYLEFLRKVHEAEMAQDLETAQYGAQVSILDHAQPPSRPKRSRRLLVALGLVATFGLAGGLGLLTELLDPVLVEADQVEALTGAPILGSVPNLG